MGLPFLFILPKILRHLQDPHFAGVKLMVDSPAVAEVNVLVPFGFDELFGAIQRIGMYEAPDVMFLIEKIGDFEFFHCGILLSINDIVPASIRIDSPIPP